METKVESKKMQIKSVKFEVVKSYCIAVANLVIPGQNALQLAISPGITIRTIAPYGATPEEVEAWKQDVLKLVGQTVFVCTITVEGFPPYVRLDKEQNVRTDRSGNPIVYTSITAYEYADNEGKPMRSEQALIKSAKARFANSKTIMTVDVLKARVAAKQQAQQAQNALQQAQQARPDDDAFLASLEL